MNKNLPPPKHHDTAIRKRHRFPRILPKRIRALARYDVTERQKLAGASSVFIKSDGVSTGLCGFQAPHDTCVPDRIKLGLGRYPHLEGAEVRDVGWVRWVPCRGR